MNKTTFKEYYDAMLPDTIVNINKLVARLSALNDVYIKNGYKPPYTKPVVQRHIDK